MEKFRKIYENKISNNDFIPTEEEFKEYEKDIQIETKEKDGCRIEFVLKTNILIGALMTDELCGMEDSKWQKIIIILHIIILMNF